MKNKIKDLASNSALVDSCLFLSGNGSIRSGFHNFDFPCLDSMDDLKGGIYMDNNIGNRKYYVSVITKNKEESKSLIKKTAREGAFFEYKAIASDGSDCTCVDIEPKEYKFLIGPFQNKKDAKIFNIYAINF